MQEKTETRSNEERRKATRAALLSAAKSLFIEKGYAETGTPEIVKKAGVTRGALYHHFDGKEGLLRSVIEAEAVAISEEIRARAIAVGDPLAALQAGAAAYFEAMRDPGRQRLMLRDGPAILGPDEMARIDQQAGAGGLADGLTALMGDGAAAKVVVEAMSDMLSAGFDRAVQRGGTAQYQDALRLIFKSLAR